MWSRGSMPTYGKFPYTLSFWRQRTRERNAPELLLHVRKTAFPYKKKTYYLFPQRYQILAHVTALSVRRLSLGLEWSKAKMVEHQRCLTQRTADKWSLLQENADGAQHPLPTQLGNNWVHESINDVTQSPKPV